MRKITYLRISLSDLCKQRCIYCVPPEGIKKLDKKEVLTFEEIKEIAEVACGECGIEKIRITGGEPLLKRDIEQIVKMIGSVRGLKEFAMTTNGLYLEGYARKLKDAGLQRVNITLNTLQQKRFEKITRTNTPLEKVIQGIRVAKRAGLTPVKLNTVLIRGVNEDEIDDLIEFAAKEGCELRFIERMKIGKWGKEQTDYFPVSEIRRRLEKSDTLIPLTPAKNSGPAETFLLKRRNIKVGFIAPNSDPFCFKCNRLRVSTDGKLFSCLMNGEFKDLRLIMRNNGHSRREMLCAALLEAPYCKPFLHDGKSDLLMSRIGG